MRCGCDSARGQPDRVGVGVAPYAARGLDVEDELMLCFAEHEDADAEHDDRPKDAQAKRLHRGVLVPQEDVAHESDKTVHGIEFDDGHDPGGGAVCCELRGNPEDGREVRPSGEDDAPQVNDVAEEDGEGTHDQADARAEEHEQEQADGQPDDVPGGDNAEPQHDERDGDQREGEVHEREQNLLNWEDEARDADLLEQRGGVDERHEGLAGGLRHEGERDVAQDEVERVVFDVGAEDEREHHAHDDHHHEGVEDRPRDTEDAAAVLALEVLGDELLQDETVFIELGFCKRLNVSGGGSGFCHEQRS